MVDNTHHDCITVSCRSLALLPISAFQCLHSSLGVTLWWEQQGCLPPACLILLRGEPHQDLVCCSCICRAQLNVTMTNTSTMWNSNWAVCSTQLEPGTVIIVPSSSVRQEKSVSWQATGILMIVCNMLWMMNKWVRVQTCFWVRDWTAPIADTLLPEQGHRSDCSIFPLLLSITFTASVFVDHGNS